MHLTIQNRRAIKMILASLLLYYDWKQEPIDRIQIVTPDHDWNDADEVKVNSDLLSPFLEWEITDLRCEYSFIDRTPILRVLIQQTEQTEAITRKHGEVQRVPKPMQRTIIPSRNAGISSFFNFLPYKQK